MKTFPKVLSIVIIIIVLGVFLFQKFSIENSSDESLGAEPSTQNSPPSIAQIHDDVSNRLRFDQASALLANDPSDPSQLSEEALLLDDPDASESEIKLAIHSLLNTIKYFSKNKTYPAGLNVEITNALLGDNDRKMAYLSVDSLRINEVGELVDDYGTPYWFHEAGAKDISVTSAGPDRILHTVDDITYPKRK